ncbi:MAG TPA: c-type cytochrome biogenesis protein CcmI [Gammaproteobacteria bacterium]|jgi:cytochrome c-type biogenesis protein CcmH|nr:c-type cytochrome biogenesis protein CcmI [Gammaproteobacteria bacterium]|tara:strand:- start:1247 stop:2422 length:1176 start_codon:yes stop_codon:yes gene_type:complete
MISGLGFIALASLALAFMVVPLLAARTSDAVNWRAIGAHRHWYKQRLQELDQEVVDSEAREALRQELAAVVLAEDDHAAAGQDTKIKTIARGWTLLASGVALVLSAVVYYSQGDAGSSLIQGAEVVLTLDESQQGEELRAWQQRLQDRVANAPDDAKSWYLLGHTLLKLGDLLNAVQAFATTDTLVGQDVSVKTYWLQARLLANNGVLDEASEAIANDILTLEPNNGPVLELLSVAMMQRGDLPQAIKFMNRALTASVSVERQIGLAGAMRVLRGRMQSDSPHVEVTISAQEPPDSDATIFVVARPPGGGMPYAAVRRPAAMLPFTVLLDDLVSMSEQRVLSAAEEFEVMVRLSRSGTAQAQSDDWVWRSGTLTVQDYKAGKKLQAALEAG